jgi:ElaB/YqjD/DUF883 family membrane-anchored ribosome-binding protein
MTEKTIKGHHGNHNHHRNLSSEISDDIAKIKAALSDTSSDLKDKANELYEDSLTTVKDKSNEVRDHIVNYTADRPLKSLGIALLAGVIIGYLIKK